MQSRLKREIKIHKINLIALLISMIVLLYIFYVIVPYADNKDFFNENEIPNKTEAFKYTIICVPILIGYVVFVLFYIRKITFLVSLNYPLIVINLYMGAFLSLLIMGGAILWLMVFTSIFALGALLLLFINGIYKDYKYIKNRNV
ncbi:membrane-associated HD superfamily phosphohydrolase [Paenibacillus anaericanus]|nr:membrane-associated HD superfamily phosphohydrolase [Paenibacillus anaericanus]